MRSNPLHHLRTVVLVIGVGAIAFTGTACKKKSGGPGGGSWLVGDDGTMSNILSDGTLGEGYDLGVDRDLLAITCRGEATAFVVGEAGTLLRTFDGGATWETIDLGTEATLRDVAAGLPDRVYVAGDAVLLVSRDSGDNFTALPGAADHAWRSIATDHEGAVALALADDGSVWRWDDTALAMTPMTTLAGGRAIALSHDGATAVVVGDAGAMSRSDDGGLSWQRIETGTDVALLAAWATGSSWGPGEVFAVGEAGTVVRVEGSEVEVANPGLGTLRAIHIDGAGLGMAAGDNGEVLRTDDEGLSWLTLDVELGTATIRGLDSVEGAGHY
jgi:photosystem II stability/assembly factor-like uncharacterized protein